AEDGIGVWSVTGVQTCALPIWRDLHRGFAGQDRRRSRRARSLSGQTQTWIIILADSLLKLENVTAGYGDAVVLHGISLDLPEHRSEERRVGKECRTRQAPAHE